MYIDFMASQRHKNRYVEVTWNKGIVISNAASIT
jgi:hypothetical protein